MCSGFALRWWLSVAGGFVGGLVVAVAVAFVPSAWRTPYASVQPAPAPSPAMVRQQEVTRLRIDLDRQLRLVEIDRQLASAAGDLCAADRALDNAIALRQQIAQVNILNRSLDTMP